MGAQSLRALRSASRDLGIKQCAISVTVHTTTKKRATVHREKRSWGRTVFACWDSLLVQRQTPDRKVVSLNPNRSSGRIFFSRVNFVCWLLLGVRVTTVTHKRPRSFCQKCRLHQNMHIPLTQRSWSGLIMPLCRHSVGTYQQMSSHATCQGTFGHSRLSLLSHCGLIPA